MVSTFIGEKESAGGFPENSETENQFIWIPVDTPIAESQEDLNNKIAQGKYPMALKVNGKDSNGRQNYIGILYDINGDTITVKSDISRTEVYAVSNNEYKEPSALTIDEDSAFASGTYGVTTQAEFHNLLQEDFNEMVSRVKRRGGFYIARFKTSLDGTTAESKSGKTDMTNLSWYDMWKYQKGTKGDAKTYMVWGCTWDQVMIAGYMGNMDEGVNEWTMEGYAIPFRVMRSGTTRNLNGGGVLADNSNGCSSRMILY